MKTLFSLSPGVLLLLLQPIVSAQTPLLGNLHDMIPPDSRTTNAVALGDVDGDGDADAFVGNSRSIQLFLNDGTGHFTEAAGNLPASSDDVQAVALGDVDGDLDLDAFVGNFSFPSPQNRLYLNDGSGVFTDATSQIPVDTDDTRDVVLFDVDGDMDLDAMLANGGSGASQQNRLYLNDGSGNFTDVTAAQMPADSDQSTAIAFGRIDGDVDLDVIITNYGGQNRLYLNNGSGTFTDASGNLPVDTDNSTSVAFGNVDGDTDLDAVIGNGGTGSNSSDRLYLNDGSGSFTNASSQFFSFTDTTFDIALVDVDGDLDLDIFSATQGMNRIYLNNGSGTFSWNFSSLPFENLYTLAADAEDLDGDGDVDFFLGVFGSNELLLNDGAGIFPKLPLEFPANGGAAVIGDLDGDVDLDVVMVTSSGVRRFLNDGTGFYSDSFGGFFPQDTNTSLALGDVDGDTDLDVLVGQSTGASQFAQNRLLVNNGNGVLRDASNQVPFKNNRDTEAVGFADVDGDGDLDALSANGFGSVSGEPNSLWLNDGTGRFVDASIQLGAPFDGRSNDLATGDVDGDMDVDIVFANGFIAAEPDHLLLNDGLGFFTDASNRLPGGFLRTIAVELVNVDTDTDLDLVLGLYESFTLGTSTLLYLNDGVGSFSDATSQLPVDPGGTTTFGPGDFDGDGDIDLLVGKGNGFRFFRNDGFGTFTDDSAQIPGDMASFAEILAGDVDDDGDVDAIATSSPVRVWTNLTRQLAWRGLPRIGKPLTLDLYGPASGSWLMLGSPGTSRIPIPPFGTLLLNPSSLAILASGGLDAFGRGGFTVIVPNDPTLTLAPYHLQSVIGVPILFSNRETLHFSEL